MGSDFQNGMQSFVFHESENDSEIMKEMNKSLNSVSAKMIAGTRPDPEDVARIYLDKARSSQSGPLREFAISNAENSVLDFKAMRVEQIPFTGNRNVKFRQTINNISAYGSAVNVEIDENLRLVSINSSAVPELKIDTVAKIGPEEALRAASEYISNDIPKSVTPLLFIYYFEKVWKLVYVVQNVISNREQPAEEKTGIAPHSHSHALPNYVNVIIDAQDGRVLKLAPRVMSLSSDARGDDGLDYTINIRQKNGLAEIQPTQPTSRVVTGRISAKVPSSDVSRRVTYTQVLSGEYSIPGPLEACSDPGAPAALSDLSRQLNFPSAV